MIAYSKHRPTSACCILLPCAWLLMVPSASQAQAPSKSAVADSQHMAKILPSVVRITTRDQSLAVLNESLGLIVSRDGLIITNSLAVKDAYIATASSSDGSTYFIESVLATEIILDLALLRVRGQKMPATELSAGVIPPSGSTVFAMKSWSQRTAKPLSGKVSEVWQTADNVDMVDFSVVMGGKGMGGPAVDKDGHLVGICNTVSRPFRRGVVGDTAICSTKIIEGFVRKNASASGTPLASAYSGAFGADGAGKLVKIWKQIEDEKYDDALRELRVMPSLLQESFVYQITLGLTQFKLNKFEAAAKSFLSATASNPYDANPAYQGGLALRRAKKFEDSVLAFQVATQRDPQHIDAYIAWGRSYNVMRQPSLAINVLSKALAIDGNNVDAHLNIGISYWGMSDREQTVDHLMQASMIAPKSAAGIRATALMDSGLPMPNEQ